MRTVGTNSHKWTQRYAARAAWEVSKGVTSRHNSETPWAIAKATKLSVGIYLWSYTIPFSRAQCTRANPLFFLRKDHGRRKRGAEGTRPPVTHSGGDVPSRFENEVAQIRCRSRFLGHFGGRLATCRRFVPHSKISVATPLGTAGSIGVKIGLWLGNRGQDGGCIFPKPSRKNAWTKKLTRTIKRVDESFRDVVEKFPSSCLGGRQRNVASATKVWRHDISVGHKQLIACVEGIRLDFVRRILTN